MNNKFTTAIAIGLFAAAPHAVQAADGREKIDACVKAFIATLGERYASPTRLRETRYPEEPITAFGVSEITLTATNPRTGQKFVAEANCTVASNGQVIALKPERFAAL